MSLLVTEMTGAVVALQNDRHVSLDDPVQIAAESQLQLVQLPRRTRVVNNPQLPTSLLLISTSMFIKCISKG